MATYSYAELEGLWINAGGPRSVAPIAAAIAEAESGGNPGAVNPNDNGGRQSSFGLWQISNGTHTPPASNWASPAENARLAVGKYKAAGGFSPWGTFNSGAYKAFISGRTTPNTNVPSPAGGPQSTAPGSIQTAASTAAVQAGTCLWQLPSFAVPLGTVGPLCFLSKSQGRSIIGVSLLGAGVMLALPGVGLLLVSAGMKAVGLAGPAVQKAGSAIALIPGAQGVGAATAAAGSAATSTAQQTKARREGRAAQREVQAARSAPARGRHARPEAAAA